MNSAPPHFASWLEKHLEIHDSILRPWQRRDEAVSARPRIMPSMRCSDEHCAHYVYGFANQQERDQHVTIHHKPAKRDSAMSIGTSPLAPAADQHSLRLLNSTHTFRQPSLAVQTGSHQATPGLTAMSPLTQTKEKGDVSPNYTFQNAHRGTRRSSADSDTDSLLPPLKRSRMSQPRLESIGELQLLRETDPCLRCRVAQKKVGENPGAL